MAGLLSFSGLAYGGSRIENASVQVELDSGNGSFSIRDNRTGYTWRQVVPERPAITAVKGLRRSGDTISARIETADGFGYRMILGLEGDSPEVTVSLAGDEMPAFLNYPFPFYPEENADMLLAMKSGLLLPVTDDTVFFKNNPRRQYQYYEGHNSSMPFHGLINPSGDGLMRLVETPNDAGYELARRDGRLVNQIRWQPQFGKVGYSRTVRYVLFDRGGYVAMADRFRNYAEQNGMVKTLRQKAADNPNVDRLIGAANVWVQDYENVLDSCFPLAQEMVDLGMSNIIFNGKSSWWNDMSADDIRKVNALGYLSCRYDIYQDVFDPSKSDLIHVNPSWVPEAWPDDIVVTKDGSFLKGWDLTGKDGKKYYCGRVTELTRTAYARRRISEELKEKPYLARLLDTEAASAWEEDYHPGRMMTRTQCRDGRMELLRYVKDEAGLVTGAEGLQCFAIPDVDYFEGISPIEPFRPADAPGEHPFATFGPDVQFDPAFVRLFSISHRYLVPLWDLVFHDCAVAYPRWDEQDNKYANDLWVRTGNLQKILCGRPPIFTFTPKYWQNPENKKLIVGIYKAVCPVARKTGYARMINHEFLTSDRDVQRTTFDNGVIVTVNFGDKPYQDIFEKIEPRDYRVDCSSTQTD
jgi:hypothetical protein